MTNSLQPAMPWSRCEPGAYVHTVNSIPLLTPEQERELAESLYYEQDLGRLGRWCSPTCVLSYISPVAIPATVWLRLT
jgi:hypothetical protein